MVLEVDQGRGNDELARPQVRELRPETKLVSDSKIVFTLEDYVVFIERKDKEIIFRVWGRQGNNPVLIVQGDVRNLDDFLLEPHLAEAIRYYIDKWKYLKEMEIVNILLNSPVKVIPRDPTDKEALAMSLAKLLVEEHNVAVLKINVNGIKSKLGIYCYEDGFWRRCEDDISEIIKGYLTSLQLARVTKAVKDEIMKNKLEILNSVTLEPTLSPLISFENGTFDWEKFIESGDLEESLRPFDKNLFVMHKIPHRLNVDLVKDVGKGLEIYMPPTEPQEILTLLKALSPRSYELLKSWAWFEGISQGLLESRIMFLLEMIGRAMLPGYRLFGTVKFKDIFALLGNTDAGKSSFLVDFMGETVIGRTNFTITKLSYLGTKDDETRLRVLGSLYGKLVVIAPDVGKEDKVHNWSTIRSISGGDPVKGRKLFENPFDYYPDYKLYMSSNDPPPIKESGAAREALLSRIKVMEFKNKFDRGDKEFKPSEFLKEEDVEAVIIASLYALRSVYYRGKYSFTGVRNVEDVWERYANPLYGIIMDMVERGLLVIKEGYKISSGDLYNQVIDYIRFLEKEQREEEFEEFEEEERLVLRVGGRTYKLDIPDSSTFTKQVKRSLAKWGVKTRKEKGYTWFIGIGLPRREARLL